MRQRSHRVAAQQYFAVVRSVCCSENALFRKARRGVVQMVLEAAYCR